VFIRVPDACSVAKVMDVKSSEGFVFYVVGIGSRGVTKVCSTQYCRLSSAMRTCYTSFAGVVVLSQGDDWQDHAA
jgi:hypothetical protein